MENSLQLLDHLNFMVDSLEKLNVNVPKDFAYRNFEDYVLQNGQMFQELSPEKVKPRPIKMCFFNAYDIAWRSKGRLQYVEGFALGAVIPVLHAWNMDEEGRVIDSTWRPPGTAYMGVPFDLEYLKETHPKSPSMIDNWRDGYPLLRKEQ